MFLPTRKHGTRCHGGLSERGFSLIELILAMALTLLLLGVVFLLFDRMFDLGETASAMADVNQNIRASVNLMARDLTMAGTGIPAGGIPLPSGTGSGQVKRPGWGSPPPTFPAGGVISAITPGAALGPTVINQTSDEVTIVAIIGLCGQMPLDSITPSGSQITVNVGTSIASGACQVNTGDLLMLQNTNGARFAMATNVIPASNKIDFAASDPMNINQPSAANGNIASLQSAGPPPFYPATVASKITMLSYFLDNSNPNVPKLMRQVNLRAPNPVAMNIVALRFTYDLSDGTTINASTVSTPNQIRKVNLQVSARSSQPLRRTRQYFVNTMTTSVTVRNLAYRNRY